MTLVADHRARWLAEHVLPHEPALRAWLTRRVVEGLEVDDVVQEAYAVLASLAGVEHIHRPRNYLFQTAQSLILQHLRRARVVRIDSVAEIDGLEIPLDEPSPERHAADRQELRQIAALIASLPEKCREVFVLRKVEGLSQREIAERMGISESTVEKHVGKGIRLLMDAVGRGGKEAGDASRGQPGVRRAHGRTRH